MDRIVRRSASLSSSCNIVYIFIPISEYAFDNVDEGSIPVLALSALHDSDSKIDNAVYAEANKQSILLTLTFGLDLKSTNNYDVKIIEQYDLTQFDDYSPSDQVEENIVLESAETIESTEVSGDKPVKPLATMPEISSPYGYRTHPITGEYKFHYGTDYAAPWGKI